MDDKNGTDRSERQVVLTLPETGRSVCGRIDRTGAVSRADSEPPWTDAHILIVDDEPANVTLLERLLEGWGYKNVVSTTDSSKVLSLTEQHLPDLLLLDLMMPPPDGFELMRLLSASGRESPVLALTADSSCEIKERALSTGASDFVTKPFDVNEVRLRARNLLRARAFQLQLKSQNDLLERRVRERTHDLERARQEVLDRLALAGEYRDDDTHEHAQRVGRTAALLALELRLPDGDVEVIRCAAPLHDIGKIGVSDSILLKPGKLTEAEFEAMKEHAQIGSNLLAGSVSRILQVGDVIARTHHERWDGTGYPRGLAGESIPLPGRLVALADVFDALTHERPYKGAWPLDRALGEIRRVAGSQLDPAVVSAFERLEHRRLLAPIDARDSDACGEPEYGSRATAPAVERGARPSGREWPPLAC